MTKRNRNDIIRGMVERGVPKAEVARRHNISRQRVDQILRKPSKQHAHKSSLGSVYFVRAAQFIKIGWTLRIQERLKNIECACPVPITLLVSVAGGRRLEYELHQRFRHLHHRGEWFRAEKDLLACVADYQEKLVSP